MKGGVGKSTIAVTVGVAFHRAGQNMLLVDADEQGTLRSWAGRGADDSADVAPVVAMDARNLARDLTRVAKDHDAVVIDTPARLGREARAAMVLSDLVLLPVARGLPGLAALDETLKIVEDARAMRPDLDVRVVLNRQTARPCRRSPASGSSRWASTSWARACATSLRSTSHERRGRRRRLRA
jgi:chromosome partitioning protein